MVAIDEEGKPHAVLERKPVSEQDVKDRESAIKLLTMRSQTTEEMKNFVDW